jgi:hypothetical protein
MDDATYNYSTFTWDVLTSNVVVYLAKFNCEKTRG